MISVTIGFRDEQQATDMAQFLKRCGWQEYRANAVNNDEAYGIKSACEVVQKALAERGFDPR